MKKRLLLVSVLLLVLMSTCFLTACNQGKETTLQFVYADGEESPQGNLPRQVIDCSKVKRIVVSFEMTSSYISFISSVEGIQTYCKSILTGFVVTDDETYCKKFNAGLSDDAEFTCYTIGLLFADDTWIGFQVYEDGTFTYKDKDGKEYVCAADSPRMDREKVQSVAYEVDDFAQDEMED